MYSNTKIDEYTKTHMTHLDTRPLFPVGVNVFVIRDGKLLLGKRIGTYHNNSWGLPGGHLEHLESMDACGKRELLEETGMTAGELKFVVCDNDVRQDNYHYVHFGFLAEDVSGEPQLMEPDRCTGWDWFPLDALPSPIFIGHERIIESFLKGQVFAE